MASRGLVNQDERSIKPRSDDKEYGFPLVLLSVITAFGVHSLPEIVEIKT